MTKEFWNKEYKDPKHLTMSTDPSSDLLEFIKWADRNAEWPAFPKHGFILDIGCGNGRNLVPLCYEFKMNGQGTEISEVALEQARNMEKKFRADTGNNGLKIEFLKQGAEDPIARPDESVDVVLDMMVSHQLNAAQRQSLVKEIVRVLKPYGWLYFKTFILDADVNAKRMIAEHPADEKNSYIHPHTKGLEHVFTVDEICEMFRPYFKIYKIKKSYKHIMDGKPFKRRTASVYMERYRDIDPEGNAQNEVVEIEADDESEE